MRGRRGTRLRVAALLVRGTLGPGSAELPGTTELPESELLVNVDTGRLGDAAAAFTEAAST